jgi:hypothetical protein
VTTLLTATITTAVSAQVGPVFQFDEGAPRNSCLQANFIYGSGGTTADFWVQTSIDGGTTWCDIANFHFTTSSARKVFNLSSLTPVTTQATPTDGTLASNTAVDGISGTKLRVKYTTVGTYGGSTTIAVDVETGRIHNP